MDVIYILLICAAAGLLAEWSRRRHGMTRERRFMAIAAIVGGLGMAFGHPVGSPWFYGAAFIVTMCGSLLLIPWLRKPA